MSNNLILIFVLLPLVFNCSSNRNRIGVKSRPSCSELESQAKDCKYVFNAIVTGLNLLEPSGYFSKNDELVSLLDCTQCLIGLNIAVVKNLFGDPNRGCINEKCEVYYLRYGFVNEERELYFVQFIFENDSLTAIGVLNGDTSRVF